MTFSSDPVYGRLTVGGDALWLTRLRRYLLFIIVGNILWEFVQLPCFTLWSRVGWNWFIFAPVLGTAGDILIAAISLVLALILIGEGDWPLRRVLYWRVAALATLQGIAYTAYSEWRHRQVRENQPGRGTGRAAKPTAWKGRAGKVRLSAAPWRQLSKANIKRKAVL